MNDMVEFDGQVIGRLGLVMTLWLDRSVDQARTRQSLTRLAEQFATTSLAGRPAWWFSSAESGISWQHTLGINGIDADLAQSSEDELLESLKSLRVSPPKWPTLLTQPVRGDLAPVGFEIVMGEGSTNAAAWQVAHNALFYAAVGSVVSAGALPIDCVRVHLPMDRSVTGTGDVHVTALERLRALMTTYLEALSILHGTAGFAVQLPLNFGYFHMNLDAAIALNPLASGFANAEVYDIAEMAERVATGLPRAQWLTFISSKFAKKADYAAAAAKRAQTEAVKATLLGGGVLLQSGDTPKLIAAGDVKHSDFKTLKILSKLTQSLRTTQWKNECIAPPPHGYANAELWKSVCLTYLREFD